MKCSMLPKFAVKNTFKLPILEINISFIILESSYLSICRKVGIFSYLWFYFTNTLSSSSFFFLRCHSSCKILVLWLGIELAPSVLKVQSANHWDCQEFFINTLSVFISPPFALSFLSDLEFCKVSLFCYKTSFLFKISQWKLYFGILPMVMISI